MNVQGKIPYYLEYCEFRKELDSKTLKAYRIDLRQYFEFCNCEDPAKEKIEEYITNLHKEYKQKTVKRKIASVKAFYGFLEEAEIIEESPFRRIKVKFKETVILPRIIPREEIERLLNCMYKKRNTEGNNGLRDIAVVETLFATGARVSEISNIRENCVDLTSGLIRIMGKGGRRDTCR